MSVRLRKEASEAAQQPDRRGNRSPHDVRLSAGGECRFKVALKRRAGNKIPCERSLLCRGRPCSENATTVSGLWRGADSCVTGSTVRPGGKFECEYRAWITSI
ncbi:hypothetical protein TNCT_100411 [Trichonephila clavata]|uniref:Uncharacterized protein n=1 Tax=Trichonephila clavata TaxID=2740835 RepID=A0A8X6KE72_TRICU|nr:hypothetical protein TNCT_100411 [Trichonephila clavata]